jgi:hypothetical protein
MNRRPSWVIAFGGFLSAFGVGIVLAQLDLGYAAVLGVGLIATVVLGAAGLGLELLRQRRPPDASPGERRLRA